MLPRVDSHSLGSLVLKTAMEPELRFKGLPRHDKAGVPSFKRCQETVHEHLEVTRRGVSSKHHWAPEKREEITRQKNILYMYYCITVWSVTCSLALYLIQPRKIILFEHGPDALRQMLCEAVVPAEYSGGIIYRQGEPGRSWPVIQMSS